MAMLETLSNTMPACTSAMEIKSRPTNMSSLDVFLAGKVSSNRVLRPGLKLRQMLVADACPVVRHQSLAQVQSLPAKALTRSIKLSR